MGCWANGFILCRLRLFPCLNNPGLRRIAAAARDARSGPLRSHRYRDDPIVAFALGRPSFDAAAREFMIGLLATVFAPPANDDRAFRASWNEPPDSVPLDEAPAPFVEALILDGERKVQADLRLPWRGRAREPSAECERQIRNGRLNFPKREAHIMNRLVQLRLFTFYPPSNLNRDDTGKPKTAIVGGATRLRVSSQSLKRAWRTSEIAEKILAGHLGERTQRIGSVVLDHLKGRVDDGKALEIAREVAPAFGKVKPEREVSSDFTEQLASVSPEERTAALAYADARASRANNAEGKKRLPRCCCAGLIQRQTSRCSAGCWPTALSVPRACEDEPLRRTHRRSAHERRRPYSPTRPGACGPANSVAILS